MTSECQCTTQGIRLADGRSKTQKTDGFGKCKCRISGVNDLISRHICHGKAGLIGVYKNLAHIPVLTTWKL